MDISVIVPVFNGESFLEKTIQSLLCQSLKNVEFIFVDDGSTDGSLSILKKFERHDPRICVIHQSNVNAGAARNAALARAQGEYLLFLDSDDFFESNLLERLYLSAKLNNLDIVACRCDFFIEKSSTFQKADWTIKSELLPKKKIFSGLDIGVNLFEAFVGWAWDKLFKRSFILENELRFQEQRTTNDLFFVFSALAKARRISTIDDILIHQRRRGTSSLSVTREKSWYCFYSALISLRIQLKLWNLYNQTEVAYKRYCVSFILWNLRTLKGEALIQCKHMLKSSWIENLELKTLGQSQYFNKLEFQLFQRFLEDDSGN